MNVSAEALLSNTKGILSFDTQEKSFSPFYSTIGLIADDGNGVGLALHYNRFSRILFHTLIGTDTPFSKARSDLSVLVCGNDDVRVAFFDTNAFLAEIKTERPLNLLDGTDPSNRICRIERQDERDIRLLAYSGTKEERDPDAEVPYYLAVRVQKGTIRTRDGSFILMPDSGRALVSFAFSCLEIDRNEIERRLGAAPDNADDAAEATMRWALSCAKKLNLPDPEPAQTAKIKTAIVGLLYNLKKAEGDLNRHLSAFPSRGCYPTHFLWDTCFQNLAYELFDPALAADLLLQNVQTQRVDGKFPQFICSTWARPHFTQPALIGWAAERLFLQTKDMDFAARVYPALKRNNNWWLTHRMTDTGLIYTADGLETGQDNSPRFDHGPTIAADMNAYLLHQMRVTARFAELLHAEDASERKLEADAFAEKIVSVLYDEADGFFYDVSLSDRERIRIVTPCGLLPLWADCLPAAEAKKCIRKHLLDKKSLFGQIPFPSVAYGESCYRHNDWWRGPTWMPEAWLMLETLGKFGFADERREAAQKLYDLIAADDRVSELFDSETGEGLGAAQQGWTCAIFLKLLSEMGDDPK